MSEIQMKALYKTVFEMKANWELKYDGIQKRMTSLEAENKDLKCRYNRIQRRMTVLENENKKLKNLFCIN